MQEILQQLKEIEKRIDRIEKRLAEDKIKSLDVQDKILVCSVVLVALAVIYSVLK